MEFEFSPKQVHLDLRTRRESGTGSRSLDLFFPFLLHVRIVSENLFIGCCSLLASHLNSYSIIPVSLGSARDYCPQNQMSNRNTVRQGQIEWASTLGFK